MKGLRVLHSASDCGEGGGGEDSVPARAQSTSTADGMWARGRTVARSSVPTSPHPTEVTEPQNVVLITHVNCCRVDGAGIGWFYLERHFLFYFFRGEGGRKAFCCAHATMKAGKLQSLGMMDVPVFILLIHLTQTQIKGKEKTKHWA